MKGGIKIVMSYSSNYYYRYESLEHEVVEKALSKTVRNVKTINWIFKD